MSEENELFKSNTPALPGTAPPRLRLGSAAQAGGGERQEGLQAGQRGREPGGFKGQCARRTRGWIWRATRETKRMRVDYNMHALCVVC